MRQVPTGPSLSPEQFRELLIEVLDDPATARLLARRLLLPFFPIQGAACDHTAAQIGPGDFGSCAPGDYTFSTGKVGIGTTGPVTRFDVFDNSGSGTENQLQVRASTDATYGVILGKNNSGATISGYHGPNWAHLINVSAAPLVLDTGNAVRLTIDGSGNVGIGTTSPATKLDVQGGAIIASDIVGGAGATEAFMEGADGVSYFGSVSTQRVAIGNSENYETLTIDGGKVGIGTTNPRPLLELVGAHSAPSTSTVPNGLFGMMGSDGVILTGGVYPAGGATQYNIWLQGRHTSLAPSSAVYNIVLEPLGGKVGIGATLPLVRLDARGSNAKATTAAFDNVFEVASTDATDPLALRAGIKTDATAGDRYGAMEVDDAGTKRPLALQASGGNVGIGTTDPKRPLHVKGGDAIVEEGGGFGLLEPGQSDPTTVSYRPGQGAAEEPYEGEDITILRTYRNAYYHTVSPPDPSPDKYTILKVWAPPGAVVNDREATLALVRGDNDEEFIDIYNNGYSSETQYGIRGPVPISVEKGMAYSPESH